jgi:hypothetical protein
MYVIAASLLGCLAMEVRVFFWGPETVSARINFRDEAVVVEEVSPSSAAARAGVRAGGASLRRCSCHARSSTAARRRACAPVSGVAE